MLKTRSIYLCFSILFALLLFSSLAHAAFTPLTPLPAPRIVASSDPYPGGSYNVANLCDGAPNTEYASDGKGTQTFVEVQFDKPVRIGAFRHLDRNDPATIAASELIFLDDQGRATSTVPVKHVNKRGGETFFALPAPIVAQRIRWHITKLGRADLRAVGGAEIVFFAAGDAQNEPINDRVEASATPFLQRSGNEITQTIRLTIHHPYMEPADTTLRIQGADARPLQLKSGATTLEIALPAVQSDTTAGIALEIDGKNIVEAQLQRKPVSPLTVYILPHSHTDIGYTEIQTAIEKKQVQNLIDGIAAARRTASYPPGARFVWNVEVAWAADLYLRRLDEKQRQEFLDAVKSGQVCLNGMYLNELTGLCRPEELLRLFRFATKLAETTGKPIDSAMISDVPGYTWGTVPAMAQAGIRYLSAAPNYFDRIGTILREWENKPFYWVGPDEKTKVLVWIPFWGYAMSHRYGQMSPQLVDDLCQGLAKRNYPFDIAYVRWSGHGDNAVPDPAICEFIRDWNAKYVSPRFVISSVSEAFSAFEKKYGDKLPLVRGDWTPYWEDGAGSSALETSMNRQSSDRLAQAETVFAMRDPKSYPADKFDDAWNHVLLYSEHTWGAWCSVREPERKDTKEQWEIKKSYADQADQQSRQLFAQALSSAPTATNAAAGKIDVINTLGWRRGGLVILSAQQSTAGDRVTDSAGSPVPSQRLSSGELTFMAKDLPLLSAARFSISAGAPAVEAKAIADGNTLDNALVRLRVDPQTGGIVELSAKGLDGNFADTSGGEAINDYLYLIGDDLKDLKRNGPVKVSVGEKGPLVASLIIESDAPGCKKLIRELRLVAGMDSVELINRVEKARLDAKSYMAKDGKESVNFAFPFNVPDGQVRMDVPFGVIRPDQDQLPSACKNWFTVGRWADVSNAQRGITWITLDAPLVQVGGITATLLNSQTNPDVWRKTVGPTQKLYCWAMNNHWGTNYRAYQEGPITFRFILRPHAQFDPAEASRIAIGISQPLIAAPANGPAPSAKPLLTIEPADVLLLGLKPSDDGRARIIRLFGAGGQTRNVMLNWGDRQPKAVHFSDTRERPGTKVGDAIEVPGNGLVTLRAEFE